MRKFLLLTSLLLLFAQLNSFAQMLAGKVISESGYAASKVHVSFLNKSNKVETNADGSFKILATSLPDTLVFSSPGTEPYKVVITEKNIKDPNFEVVLLNKRSDFAKMSADAYESPIVSEGDGIKRKPKELGYSVSKAATGLAGKVSGLTISAGTGAYYRAAPTGSAYTGDRKFNMLDSLSPGIAAGKLMSQVLTAGEVNDFNKWKMWGDLSAGEFKLLSAAWGVAATKRYTVQLQNANFAAIINEPVYLIDKKTNRKIWSAVTDNTGKAELWAGYFGKADSLSEYIIKDGDGNIINDPVTFNKGINHLLCKKNCGSTNKVDIAFVVDATGSMGDEIEYLKFEMEDVIRNTFNSHSDLDLKVASVFYRDIGDEYVTKHVDFQSDLLKVLNFVKLQRDGGGGDTPEAVDSAMDVALSKLSWRTDARTRLMFLFLDAPPHDEAKPDMYRLIAKAAAMGVRIVPVACSGSDKSNEFLLRSMALATNGTYAFLTDHSGIGNKHTEASTDSYNVELLNNLLQRIIQQFIYVRECKDDQPITQQVPLARQPENLAKIRIYPNPTQGNATIASDKELKEVYITDFTGKMLMKLSSEAKYSWAINVSRFPSGTYLVRYVTGDNKWGMEKLVLIH